ncbi:MAG TPA: MlaD family protein [Balneolales bacterium]|nr:MlaD family protein [Balneolales bacterium]
MKFTKNEMKIGLTIVGALIIGILGFRYMRGIPIFNDSKNLVCVFPQADGLTAGKQIYINGVNVGSVKSMKLLSSDSVRVILSLNDELKIPADSKAYIRSTDLLGSKAVVIQRGSSARMLHNGNRITGVYDQGMFSEIQKKGLTIGDKVAEVSSNVNSLVLSLNQVFNNDVKKNLSGTLNNLQESSAQLDDILKKKNRDIQASITHFKNILGNVDTLSTKNRNKLDSLITNLQASSKQIGEMSDNLNKVSGQLNQILTKINNGQGTLGKLVNDDHLYNNLDSLSSNLQKVMRHFNNRPQDYLRYVTIKLF